MRYAIYGDSYADGDINSHNLNYLAWHSHLAKRLGGTQVSNYARAGTPFFYTYKKILETASQYDRIIVAVTEPMRYTKTVNGVYVTGVGGLSAVKDPRTGRALVGWFTSLDFEFMDVAQDLMIADILAKYPSAVIIPCFKTSLTAQRKETSGWGDFCLNSITLEAKRRVDPKDLNKEIHSPTGIICHMPADWQVTVGEMLYRFIKKGRASLELSLPLLKHPAEKYYRS